MWLVLIQHILNKLKKVIAQIVFFWETIAQIVSTSLYFQKRHPLPTIKLENKK